MPKVYTKLIRFILLLFALLALLYAWATPPFEASDELWHFGMVQALATEGELPVQTVQTSPLLRAFCLPTCGRLARVNTLWEQEGSQPPLYYMLIAAVITPIDRSDFDTLRQPNPHALAGIPGAVGNKNLVLQDTPHPALQGTALAVYIGRGVSVALGLITVSAVYAAGRILTPERPQVALLAAGITAFNPMFLFITASVNNDNLVTALNSLILWQMLVLLRDGFSARRNIMIAVPIALASLSKLSGNVLIPVVALAACYLAYRHRDLRGLIALGITMIGLWLLIAGWWYLRNLLIYGELFGTSTMVAVAGAREGQFTLQTLLDEFQGFRFAYWGLFGAVNIQTFRWFYDVMDVLTIIAIGGLAWHLITRSRQRDYLIQLALLALVILIGAVSVILWTAQTYASQGRLLFPFVGATSTLLALGLGQIIERFSPSRRGVLGLPMTAVMVFGAFAAIVPLASIAPQYQTPAPLTALPPTAQPVYARFSDVALIGYETPDQRYTAGDTLPITVYWQVLDQSPRDNSLWLHAVASDGTVIGKVDSYPGGGKLRTTQWQAGAIYADTYAIPLEASAVGRYLLRVQVGWWHYPTEANIPAVDPTGSPLDSVMLNAGGFLSGDLTTQPDHHTDAVDFGGMIRLTGYTLAENNLVLFWEAVTAVEADYTVFVQVVDAENNIIGQGDAPPDLPTHYWRAGEKFITQHVIYYLQPPNPDTYRLLIGWYHPETFARLTTDAPDNAHVLLNLTLP